MSEAALFAYDAVIYPGRSVPQTQPDRLAAIATLFGMRPAPPSRCRVLELGCGVGANLMPLAARYPESHFVGIDLSEPTIAQGRGRIAAHGLGNIELRAGDIMEVDASFGEFDYIVAHGVYSWVPDFVRGKIMTILRERLAPQGVGFVSYNAYPASHLRDLGRRMMLFHARMFEGAETQVQQGRALLRFIGRSSGTGTTYGAAVQEALSLVGEKSDEVLYHDDFDAGAQAFLFHQVVEAAEREGLQYLCESTLKGSTFGVLPDYAQAFLDHLGSTRITEREQYLDLLAGRWFRETLFCHRDVALERDVAPDAVTKFAISAQTAPGVQAAGDDALTQAAFLQLERAWPRAVAFPDLARGVLAALRESRSDPVDAGAIDGLAPALWRGYREGAVHFHIEPPRAVPAAGERPRASAFARKQAEAGPEVATLRHETITLDGALHPFFLLLDGSRGIDELSVALERLVAEGGDLAEAGGPEDADPRRRVARVLDAFARLSLLTA